ncbi:AraC-type DNA-binding protein [Marivirga sericea]|uniref:AraC-type DNA-binding protein n=1 Tax=Marivirga sericea TaxID=1028 RepID=A0A1X7LD78_9BACT|nr:AraC family transcriptional regulator [Marivirga sericea]SMG51660.1 AraC-type DNA-binding protein [Marivirga sericea]
MKIKTFQPLSQELQKYIECFYILSNSKEEEKVSYLTFPTLFSVVGAVMNAKNIVTDQKVTISFSKEDAIDTSLVCRFNKPIFVEYEGEIKEICIYFKPLGLNAFLEKPLENYSHSFVDEFIPFPDYEMRMQSILKMADDADLAINIEQYWLDKLIGFKHPFLHAALDAIHQDPNITTNELAKGLGVSQKTFIKQFKKHLCKTPTEFKKILRFRIAISEKQKSFDGNRLTELAYISNFFDQSHMVASFKSLTGFAPKSFFQRLSTTNGDNINWIFTAG